VKTRFYSCERERDTRQPAWVIGIEEKGLKDLHEYSRAGEVTPMYLFRSSATGASTVYNPSNAPSWMRRLQGLGSTQYNHSMKRYKSFARELENKWEELKARKMGGNFDVHCGRGRSPYIPYRRLRRPEKGLRVHRARRNTMRTCGNLSEAICIAEA
jgi:hypothetical protein